MTVPLYRVVADRVEAWIEEGTLEAGSRIPSLRSLSRQLGCSVTTAMEAYRVLEDRGLVEVRPQSGHYVRLGLRTAPPTPLRTTTCSTAATLDTAATIERLVAEASRTGLVVPLGAAVPSAALLPTKRLANTLAKVVKRDPIASQAYGTVPGRLELRSQIARRTLEAGCELTANDIVVTTGAQEAIALALQSVTKPGDTVAIETPTYHGFLQALESLHLRAVEIATDPQTGICLGCLEDAIVEHDIAACIVVASFGNPLGHSMPEENRRRLAQLLAAADLPLIEDDTYGELPFGDRRPPAVKAYDEDGRVLLCSSFSKTLAPGFRVGWIAPGRYREALIRNKLSASLASAVPTQMALAEYLASGGFDRHLRRLRRHCKDAVRRMISEVGEAFPVETRVTRPQGGHVVWVELPTSVDTLEIHRQALEEGISIIPGPIFSPTRRYSNCLRLNCAVPWSPQVEHALQRLGELIAVQLDGRLLE